MANFFTPASQKKPEPITWRIVGTSLIVGKYVPEKSAPQTVSEQARRIASFDLVGDLSIRSAGMKHWHAGQLC